MGELFHFSCEIFYQPPRPSLKGRILFSDLEELLPTYYGSIYVSGQPSPVCYNRF